MNAHTPLYTVHSYQVLPRTQFEFAVVAPGTGRHITVTRHVDGRWRAPRAALYSPKDARAAQRLMGGLKTREGAASAALKVLLGGSPRAQVR